MCVIIIYFFFVQEKECLVFSFFYYFSKKNFAEVFQKMFWELSGQRCVSYSCCSSYLSLNEKMQHLLANWYQTSFSFSFSFLFFYHYLFIPNGNYKNR